jgi:hypothetical protein
MSIRESLPEIADESVPYLTPEIIEAFGTGVFEGWEKPSQETTQNLVDMIEILCSDPNAAEDTYTRPGTMAFVTRRVDSDWHTTYLTFNPLNEADPDSSEIDNALVSIRPFATSTRTILRRRKGWSLHPGKYDVTDTLYVTQNNDVVINRELASRGGLFAKRREHVKRTSRPVTEKEARGITKELSKRAVEDREYRKMKDYYLIAELNELYNNSPNIEDEFPDFDKNRKMGGFLTKFALSLRHIPPIL